MEKKEDKTGLAFIDRVREVATELVDLQQQAPADNKAGFIMISTQCAGGERMNNCITVSGAPNILLHVLCTAMEDHSFKKTVLTALLAYECSHADNEEGADE